MWSTHAAPAHGHRGQTRMAKSNSESTTSFGFSHPDSSATSSPVPSSSRVYPPAAASSSHHHHHQYTVSALEAENYADFFEPAVEGPPSPGGIRAFSNKVRQVSVSDRHVNHQQQQQQQQQQLHQQPTSSAASSLLSYASLDRRPSWEQALESFSLSRKSSVKSTTSSMPSRERPESVQAIGKAIFHRKSKFRRESLATSGSSTYSSEATLDVTSERSRAASAINKDHISSAMSLFNRRKTVQAVEEAQKRPSISSPFNFQHVTQIQRDQLPSLERANSTTLRKEMAIARSPPTSIRGVASRGPSTEDLRVPNFSSKTSRPYSDDESIPPHVVPHSREGSLSQPPSAQNSPPRQWVKQVKSQDHMRGPPPPRPPRSPTELDLNYFDYAPRSAAAGPAPPARHPSRGTSIPRRDSEALGHHQQGMNAFRFPAPLNLQGGGDAHAVSTPPLVSPGCASPAAAPTPPADSRESNRRFSRIFVPAENPNWPLTAPLNNASVTTFEAGLPDVPEEEEQGGLPKRSRASMRSTHSSLKGSISVPALRQTSVSNAGYPPSSHHNKRASHRESVVFGQYDIYALQQPARDANTTTRTVAGAVDAEPLRRDSWEAVIDYCYEHEMEADCDYDWHRPSVDMPHHATHAAASIALACEDEGLLLSRPTSDVPALSPCSHLSPQTSHEAITPTLAATAARSPTSANFSLPRRDGLRNQRHLHVRTESQTSFKEAQGFSLSPSFLIPTDYHHELLAARTEQQQYDDPDSIVHAVTLEEDPTLTMENSSLFVPARASNSTTTSNSNLSSQSVFERHISATSSNTDYTRLTMSTSSDMDTFVFKDDSPITATANFNNLEDQIPEIHEVLASPAAHGRSHSAAGLLGSPSSLSNKATPTLSRDTHNSDSNLAGLQSQAQSSPKRQAAAGGRARSRTMSSTPGQFSLFPAVPSSKAPPPRG